MILLRAIFALILIASAGCTQDDALKPDDEIRSVFGKALAAEDQESLKPYIFIPPSLEVNQKQRILDHRIGRNSYIKKPVQVDDVIIKGRWASVTVDGDKGNPLKKPLLAFHSSAGWKLFWDPMGTLLWGKQEWHRDLSETDWEDYRAIIK